MLHYLPNPFTENTVGCKKINLITVSISIIPCYPDLVKSWKSMCVSNENVPLD